MRKLITIVLILFAVQGFGQVLQENKSVGWQYKILKIDSTLYVPTFCGVPSLRGGVIKRQGAFAIDTCNKKLYFYDPKDSSWNIVGSGVGGSTLQDAAEASFTAGDNPVLNFHGQTFIIDSAALYRMKTNYGSAFQIGNNVDGFNYIQLGDLDINGHATQFVLNDADSSITLSARNLKMPYLKTDTASTRLFVTTDTATNKIYRQALPTYTEFDKFPLYHDGDTAKIRLDSMPQIQIADTSGMPGNGVPTLDMVNARMGGGGSGGSYQLPYNGTSTDYLGGDTAYHALPFQSLTTTGTSGAATLSSGVLNIPQYSGGGTTADSTITASSGATTFTFTSVPATYSDYIIFVNGCKVRSITDYTTSGDVVSIPSIVDGDIIEYQRVK